MKLQLPHSGSQGRGAKHNKKIGIVLCACTRKKQEERSDLQGPVLPLSISPSSLTSGRRASRICHCRQTEPSPACLGGESCRAPMFLFEQNLVPFFEPTERGMVLGPRMHRRGNGRDLTPPASASEMGLAVPGMNLFLPGGLPRRKHEP